MASSIKRIVIPTTSKYSVVTRNVTDTQITSAYATLFDNTAYVENGNLCFTSMNTSAFGHQAGDMYYFKITQGASSNTNPTSTAISVGGYTGYNNISGYTQQTTAALLGETPGTGFDSTEMVGRKIKISIQTDTTSTVKSWAEGASYSANEIVYSDNKYYKCGTAGTSGKAQPTHTEGTRTDGSLSWTYLHAGFGYVTILSVESSTSMTGYVNSTLPYITGDSTTSASWDNYQWSMWGYKSKYPNQVFMFNGRLGYTLATEGYGSWLQMSKSDEFDDFSTEEYGETTDICGINTLISEYNENKINWVLAGYRLYMGSYAGEYNITGGDSDKALITPSSCQILPVCQAGGGPVKACKFEDLNLFVSADKKQVFNLRYEYTADDYIPDDVGIAGEDLLTGGIASMWHLRGYDRNLYARTDDNKLIAINQPGDAKQKLLGFFRVDMQGDVLDHCVSNAEGVSTQFVLVKRGTSYTVEFVEPDYEAYMFNVKEYTATDPNYVAETITETMYASQNVYVFDNSTGEFVRQSVGTNGVINNPFTTRDLLVGIEMPCVVHTHPLYNDKLETTQQKAVRYTIRVVNSGAFSYGCSNTTTWYDYNNYNVLDSQSYGSSHKLMTGDITLPSSFGYQQAQNKASSEYPNDTATALNLKACTPEPFNLLLVSSIYV